MEAESTSRRRLPLATRILLGLVVGAATGVAANLLFDPGTEARSRIDWFAENVAHPVGQVFLRLLFMVVVPLVFSSLALGVAGLGNLRNLGRVGGKTLLYFLSTTAVAATLGILLVNALDPGYAMSASKAEEIRQEFSPEAEAKVEQGRSGTGFGVETFVNIIPRNVVRAAADEREMLALIFFALMVGIGATFVPAERVRPFLAFLDGLYEICVVIIQITMRLAPYGVAGLVFFVTSKFGFEILQALAFYVVTVLGGLIIHQFLILPLVVLVLARVSPRLFFSRAKGLMVTAFSLSSSNATLPTTIRTAEREFGVPRHLAGFILPLGATLNMNGTALFEGVTVLFLAQVSGVDLDLGRQAIVVALAVLTAIGTAGVPGGSLPLLALVLAQVGVQPEMLGVVLGVDRILDMARTVPNVTGDLTASLVVARSEGSLAIPLVAGGSLEPDPITEAPKAPPPENVHA